MLTINTILITFGIGALAILLFEYILRQSKSLLGQNGNASMVRKTMNLFRLIFYSFLIIAILGALSVNLIGLLASASIIGIVLGLAVQVTLSNFIAGIYITFTKLIKLNQVISINAIGSNIQITGQIKHLGFSHVELYGDQNGIRLIPNSLFLTSIITLHDTKEDIVIL